MKIIEIISIVDTRTYEEVNDRWVAIPGSGIERECGRCGRLHEVHATVRLEDGSLAIIGTGCAKNDDMAPALRRGTSTAKTLARNTAKLVALKKRLAEVKQIIDEVDALELPPVEQDSTTLAIGREKGRVVPLLRMGDATVWLSGTSNEKERLSCLENSWRNDQLRKRGTYYGAIHGIIEQIRQVERRLAK